MINLYEPERTARVSIFRQNKASCGLPLFSPERYEPEKAQELMEQLSEWEQTCCKDPLWIEEGWAEITNGLHERLMKNEIRTAQDL